MRRNRNKHNLLHRNQTFKGKFGNILSSKLVILNDFIRFPKVNYGSKANDKQKQYKNGNRN